VTFNAFKYLKLYTFKIGEFISFKNINPKQIKGKNLDDNFNLNIILKMAKDSPDLSIIAPPINSRSKNSFNNAIDFLFVTYYSKDEEFFITSFKTTLSQSPQKVK
jgi:hypothetical protein